MLAFLVVLALTPWIVAGAYWVIYLTAKEHYSRPPDPPTRMQADLNHPCVRVIMAELSKAGVLSDSDARFRNLYRTIYGHMEYFDTWKSEMREISNAVDTRATIADN